ncbi:hypothetical protein N2152v2_007267 [Parachlorella kessleri]
MLISPALWVALKSLELRLFRLIPAVVQGLQKPTKLCEREWSARVWAWLGLSHFIFPSECRARGAEALPHGDVAYFPIAVDPESKQAYMDQPSMHMLLRYRDNDKLKNATASLAETGKAELGTDRTCMLQDTKLRVPCLVEGLPAGVHLVHIPGSLAPLSSIQ